MRWRTYKHLSFFSFVRQCSKSPSCNRIPAIVIAIHGQKTLHFQLSKVILSGMYNCSFEAINWVLNKKTKKLDVEYGPLICKIIFYVILYIRFRKEFLMLSLREELNTIARDFFSFTLRTSYICSWLF